LQPLQLCVPVPVLCLQLVTLLHVRSQLPLPQFCSNSVEPLPMPSHDPFAQF
jgi:hypothetical protein